MSTLPFFRGSSFKRRFVAHAAGRIVVGATSRDEVRVAFDLSAIRPGARIRSAAVSVGARTMDVTDSVREDAAAGRRTSAFSVPTRFGSGRVPALTVIYEAE